MAFVNFREPELECLLDKEMSDEWHVLVTDLGMVGQLQNTNQKDGAYVNPIPYTSLNKKWLRIFKTLCGAKSLYNKYSKSTIPVEALHEIKLCVDNNYFSAIEVWYDDNAPDPLIIGVCNTENKWEKNYFLIARFGDEILPFELLEQKAYLRLLEIFDNSMKQAAKTIPELVNKYIQTGEDVDLLISRGHAI